jgi:hypothetical protein
MIVSKIERTFCRQYVVCKVFVAGMVFRILQRIGRNLSRILFFWFIHFLVVVLRPVHFRLRSISEQFFSYGFAVSLHICYFGPGVRGSLDERDEVDMFHVGMSECRLICQSAMFVRQ